MSFLVPRPWQSFRGHVSAKSGGTHATSDGSIGSGALRWSGTAINQRVVVSHAAFPLSGAPLASSLIRRYRLDTQFGAQGNPGGFACQRRLPWCEAMGATWSSP